MSTRSRSENPVTCRLAALACLLLLSASVVAQTDGRPRVVSVSGQGEVQAEPDRAAVMLGIQARQPKLDDARAQVNQKVDAILKLTRELKIDPKYVRSTRINIQPEYNFDNNGRERNLVGYFVSRQVEVDLRNLEQLGQLLERSASLGVNQLGDPRLDSSKRKDLEREALTRAVADARLNAETLVKAAGGRLGAVRSMSATSNSVSPPMPFLRGVQAALSESNGAEQSYQTGQMNFTASVQIEYDLAVDAGG
jgi:uncharacterized protein